MKNVKYESDIEKRYGFGYVEGWDIRIDRKENNEEIVFSKLDELIDSLKKQWNKIVNSILDNSKLQKEIDEIPAVDVKISI